MLAPIASLPHLLHLHLADCPFDRDPLVFTLEPGHALLPGLPDFPQLTYLSLAHFALPLAAVRVAGRGKRAENLCA